MPSLLIRLLTPCLFVFTAITQAQDLDPSFYYRLTTQWQGEGKSLDIISDAQNNKPILAPSGNTPGQTWKLTPLGNGLYRLSTHGQGDGKSLDIVNDGQNNKPILAASGNYTGQMWKLTPLGNGFYRLSTQWQGEGKSLDIVNDGQNNKPILAASGNYSGQMWKLTKLAPVASAVAPEVTPTVTSTGNIQAIPMTGQLTIQQPEASAPATLEPVPRIWPPSIMGLPAGGGALACSRVIGTTCGTSKADYVGAYTLDTTCDSGFYDMIYGGTCWKCPDDTDANGTWIRTADAIEKDTACHRALKAEKLTNATKVLNTPWAWDCPSGSFWDGAGGGCWTCPATHPRRTGNVVWASNACATGTIEAAPAIFLAFNGCPKPNAGTMKLAGKRMPGKPFLDIAGGWSQGVASGGCYACPVADEEGNILVTERNAAPIYGNNQGCDVLFKWKPNAFPEPGMAGLAGMKEFIVENKLLESPLLTARLYYLAESRGLGKGTPAAKDWVVKQWQEIAAAPYRNEQFRAIVFANLAEAGAIEAAKRTPAQTKLIGAFQDYIKLRRIYLGQMGLAMYDAWKAYDDKAKQSRKQSRLGVMFDYGTVPLDFHSTLSAVTTLGAVGAGLGGALAAAHALAAHAKVVEVIGTAGVKVGTEVIGSFGLSTGRGALAVLNLFKGTAVANAALAGTTVIMVAFAIIQSVAIDQFIAIETARPKLVAALWPKPNNRLL